MNGVTEQQIIEAEQKFGLKFFSDYREYLSEFGIVSFGGHEFTGICSSTRLNVVDVCCRTS
ncbi:MAG: SMI1/KNR4 family protein [Oscillospiraceae bacterium]|nr:SMI1/KNR4 family protein [Oscillospiraceae bacterium]